MKMILTKTDFQSEFLDSLSARKKAEKAPKVVKESTLESLIPVQLSDADRDEFISAFHPKAAAQGPQAFVDEASFLVEVSAYISAVFSGLRHGMQQLTYFQPNADGTPNPGPNKADLGAKITKDIENSYKSASELKTKVKIYLQAMSKGTNHIIVDSIRTDLPIFKGGKDILYVGVRGPNVSPLLSAELPATAALPAVKSSFSYTRNKVVFDSDYGKAFVQTGLQIQQLLFSDQISKLSSSYARIMQQHLIGANWTIIDEVTKIFMQGPLAKLGIPVLLPVFNGAMTTHASARLAKYVSVLALREPNHTIVTAKARQTDVPDESLDICLEHLALQPDIRFSFAVNMPKIFCEYITQTADAQIPLVPLNTWATVWSTAMLRPPRTRASKEDRESRDQDSRALLPDKAPHYVFRPSISDELIQRRKKLGLYTEAGRVNEDGLYVTGNGDIAFLNTAEDSAVENAKTYEKLAEEALELSFAAGTPITGQAGSTGLVYDIASPQYAEKISALKEQLKKYRGSVQAINWDLNAVLAVSIENPNRIVSYKLTGASRPDELNLATYLRSPVNVGFRDMFSRTKLRMPDKTRPMIDKNAFQDVRQGIATSQVFINFANFYNHLLKLGKVPTMQELVDKAAAELKVKDLGDEEFIDFELIATNTTRSIYQQIISRELKASIPDEKTGQAIVAILGVVAGQAAADAHSNLARICIRDNIEFVEHDRYFDGQRSTLGDFARLYTWLGGQIFRQAILAILAVPKKELLSPDTSAADPLEAEAGHPGFLSLINEVMPMCVVLSKYVTPEIRDSIYKKADEIKERETQFTDADLNLAGSKPANPDGTGGMKLFPHQAQALAALKAHPKIAVLDISPGGGKTTIGLADIACLYADGLIKKPFIFCPNRLVRNWIEDLHKSFRGWNAIPVTTETIREWGEERLTDMILSAPPNTIVIVGNSFISSKVKTQIVIGNVVDVLSNSVEFCKKFQPDYVMVDESHRIRNHTSDIHKGIKAIMLMSSIKYGRIGTGTLIQNVLSDVVGQSAVFSGQIFRTKDEYDREHKGVVGFLNDKPINDYLEGTAAKARRRLSEFATVISFKRKEWAFMLPLPIEKLITVEMDDKEFGEAGHNLQLFYNAVLKETLEEAKHDKNLKKQAADQKKREAADRAEAAGLDPDDEEFTEADKKSAKAAEKTVTSGNGTIIDVTDEDDDSDDLDELEATLQPYLARLERILTDPFGDPDLLPVARGLFGDDFDAASYVTPKVQKVIERVKLHFTEIPWQKGAEYSATDMVDFNGKSYIFKAHLNSGQGTLKSEVTPDSDTENWKPQSRGKIFIACRYTRSVDAIFRALPAEYKKQAVRFHGEIDGKDVNLAKFMSDPKTTILIANEMGVSEGHNFQMASRFIRVESPWAPGELDQTASRIFRPDVGGKYVRESIFLDWILCDETLEVAKMGRLISKMLKRASFDELDNPKYYKNLNPENLGVIKMSLENIKKLHSFNDLCGLPGLPGSVHGIHQSSYIGQYTFLVQEMNAEFREMKKTKPSQMIPVEATAMPEGSSIVEFTPWVSELRVEDRHGDGLRLLREALEDDEFPLANEVKKSRKALLGQYVRTEYGIGVIVGVTSKKGKISDADANADANADPNAETDDTNDDDGDGREVSKVRVQFAQGGEIRALSASRVYLALNITEQNKGKYNKIAPKIGEADRKRTEKARIKAEKALEKIRQREEKVRIRLERIAKRGKQIVIDEYEEEVEDEEPANELLLYPMVYNGYLAVEGTSTNGDTRILKRFGFKDYGKYAYLPIKNYQAFTAVLEFLEKHYTLDRATTRTLDSLHDSFSTGRGRKFAVELAPISDFKQFFNEKHRTVIIKNQRRPELRIYPVVFNGTLVLVVDMKTNPKFGRHVVDSTKENAKPFEPIPGMPTKDRAKFELADGMSICFLKNKTAVKNKVREIQQAGYVIQNYADLKAQTIALTTKQT